MPKLPKLNMEELEDMFKFNEQPQEKSVQNGIMELEFDLMESFPNHKFKLYEGQQLADMVESIKNFGVLLPIILWLTEGKYTILSGHNRKNAAVLAGFTKAPVIIKENLTHEEATLIVTETNLRQRSFYDLSHSERAFCLAQHYEALKSQGKRNDILEEIEMLLNPSKINDSDTCSHMPNRLKSLQKVGNEYGLSKDKVARYVRISTLNQEFLVKLDNGEIAFLSAYELSFINKETQRQIISLMETDNFKLDMKKAELLRQYYEKGNLSETIIYQILSGEKSRKPKSDKPQAIKVTQTIVSKYFTKENTPKEISETIDKALEFYFSHKEKEGEPIG